MPDSRCLAPKIAHLLSDNARRCQIVDLLFFSRGGKNKAPVFCMIVEWLDPLKRCCLKTNFPKCVSILHYFTFIHIFFSPLSVEGLQWERHANRTVLSYAPGWMRTRLKPFLAARLSISVLILIPFMNKRSDRVLSHANSCKAWCR